MLHAALPAHSAEAVAVDLRIQLVLVLICSTECHLIRLVAMLPHATGTVVCMPMTGSFPIVTHAQTAD